MKYKLLGRSGLRVSELCLGTMTFGTEWALGADYADSKSVFETYAEAGGNFIDTANRYTEGTSEKWVGEFVAADRDHFVVATKFTLSDRPGDPNFFGNHRKNMMRSVEDSLRRLNTSHIDLLWLHAWDGLTPVDEVLRGMDDLIRQGKVQYIGISDTPAWVVSQANVMAELKGWTQFAGLQVEYSLIRRDIERDLLPMAKHFGMSVTPWGAMAGGVLTGKYLKGEQGRTPAHSARRSDRANTIAQAVVDIAAELDAAPGAVALAWVRQQWGSIIPIVGAKTGSQLAQSLTCLEVTLSPTQLAILEDVSKIDLGFPHDFLTSPGVEDVMFGGVRDQIINTHKL
jgi:aryl-alcohol dehydrogenase-like predicted oxidoreductase